MIDFRYEIFSSLNDFASYLENATLNQVACENPELTNGWTNPEKEFTSVSTRSEYLSLLKGGYKQGVSELKKLDRKVLEFQKRIQQKYDVVGAYPCVPKVILGHPKNMINLKVKKIPAKVINLIYDCSVSCWISPETILLYTAKLIAVIKQMEMEGYRFNIFLIAGTHYSYNNKVFSALIKIKDAQQQLDLVKVSFPLLHPAFFRCSFFEFLDKAPFVDEFDEYRGSPLSTLQYEEIKEDLESQIFHDNIVFLRFADLRNEEELKRKLIHKK